MRPIAYVGIDASLTSTGVAVRCGKKQWLFSFGLPAQPDRFTRYVSLRSRLFDEIDQRVGIVELRTAIEHYSMGSNRAQHSLSIEYGYEVRRFLQTHEIDMVEVPPTSLKKFTCGSGKGEKSIIGLHVGRIKDYADLTPANSDEADALALLDFARVWYGDIEPRNKVQREQLEKLRAGPKKKVRKKGNGDAG